MKIVITIFLFLLMSTTTACAADESIEDLIAQLEGKSPEETAQEKGAAKPAPDEGKFAEDLEKERIELKKKLWSLEDGFNGTAAYRSNRAPREIIGGNEIFFTLHDSGTDPLLVCHFSFILNNMWIALREIQVNIDGKIYDIELYGARKAHDYVCGNDAPIYSQQDEVPYVKIINSETAMVRFVGVNDQVIGFTVTENQKEALREVLRYYYIRQYQTKLITMEKYLEKAAEIE